MEQLRPPDGFRLDRVIGTTFSLDLYSLLIAPLSMVLFEYEGKNDALKDPTAILEALRMLTDKIAIFCQKGRIIVPKGESYLFSYLEPIVIEVVPENIEGVFHPKLWILRYVNKEKDINYRLLCLSRNLTFDHSWDTILTLDGSYRKDRQRAFARNRPLSDFIRALPDLSKNITLSVRKNIKLMADEILKVDFDLPEGFEDIKFHPIGIPGYKNGPEIRGYERSLVISPFLSDEVVKHLANKEQENILISRPESFDELNPTILKSLSEEARLFIMQQTAERPQDSDNERLEYEETLIDDDLNGLHAKLYILETGWYASVFTGSANATNAALKGVNVEFLTEIEGKKSIVGIDPLLGKGKNAPEMSLLNLLVPYSFPENSIRVDQSQKKLEEKLQKLRNMILQCNIFAKILQDEKNYRIELASTNKLILPEYTKITCWPIMLSENYEKDIAPLSMSDKVIFSDLSLLSLTRFFAFKIIAKVDNKQGLLKFALNVPLEGMPEERNKNILNHIIGNSERFIRYLLFLLSDNPEQLIIDRIIHNVNGQENSKGGKGDAEIPLLEELVRAFSRYPEKISRIDSLVIDLKKTEEGRKILPCGFDEIWLAFKNATSTEGQK